MEKGVSQEQECATAVFKVSSAVGLEHHLPTLSRDLYAICHSYRTKIPHPYTLRSQGRGPTERGQSPLGRKNQAQRPGSPQASTTALGRIGNRQCAGLRSRSLRHHLRFLHLVSWQREFSDGRQGRDTGLHARPPCPVLPSRPCAPPSQILLFHSNTCLANTTAVLFVKQTRFHGPPVKWRRHSAPAHRVILRGRGR